MRMCRKPPGGAEMGGGRIRILSAPVPMIFRFASAGLLMDALERAVRTLHVLSSGAWRVGSRFFLCVTVRFAERIAARSLFSEYGCYVGCGALRAAHFAEQAESSIPDIAARMAVYL